MRLQRFVKYPIERKRYRIDYSEWLDTTEVIDSVSFSVLPISDSPLVVDAFELAEDGKGVVFFVSDGDVASNYTVYVTATTNGGQTKEDTVLFAVREPT